MELAQKIASKEDPAIATTDVPCRVRAWVRAPNLGPGQVVQGQVKIKHDGSCDDIASYSLGLHFAERSWVKTRREGATLPVKPTNEPLGGNNQQNKSIYEDIDVRDWGWPFGFRGDQFALDQYESDLKNPALWLVREEERVAFETKYKISDGTQKPGCDIVESFAILVPSTNYPPASDRTHTTMVGADVNTTGAEHIYKYFVDVIFSDGAHKQIEAGYTSFDVVAATELDRGPVSVNVMATSRSLNGEAAEDGVVRDKFTFEVTFPKGKHFEQGSRNDITIISRRLGPGTWRPLDIDVFTQTQQKHHWAAKHAADNQAAEELLRYNMMASMHELQPRVNSQYANDLDPDLEPDILPFSQDVGVESDTVFSTEPLTEQFDVPANVFPPFEMYYQTLDTELAIRMRVQEVFGMSSPGTVVPVDDSDEEYDWTPYLLEETVHRRTTWERIHFVWATIPISMHRGQEHHTPAVSNLVHYLSPEARSPVFVDPSSLPQLFKMTLEERNSIAPHCKPKITAKSDGDVVKERYHARGSRPPQAHYYVGDTWQRKVLERGGGPVAQHDES